MVAKASRATGCLSFTFLLVTACAVTRHGTLEEVAGGVTFPVTVTVEADSAWVRAVDPRHGEVVQGRLTLDPKGGRTSPRGAPEPPLPSGSGGLGAAGAGVPLRGRTVMHLVGELHGDRGTSLHCTVQVEQRIHLRGNGFCHPTREGTGSRFFLRF